VSWRLGNSIGLKSQDRFAALENVSDFKDMSKARESIKGNMKVKAKERLGLYGGKQHNFNFLKKNFHNFLVKGGRLKCSGYRIQTKVT
jgi:hypothetical protein